MKLTPNGMYVPVPKELLAELLFLILRGHLLNGGVVEFLVVLQDAARELEPPVSIERPDPEHAAASDRARGHG